jgi:hypothetical protein
MKAFEHLPALGGSITISYSEVLLGCFQQSFSSSKWTPLKLPMSMTRPPGGVKPAMISAVNRDISVWRQTEISWLSSNSVRTSNRAIRNATMSEWFWAISRLKS